MAAKVDLGDSRSPAFLGSLDPALETEDLVVEHSGLTLGLGLGFTDSAAVEKGREEALVRSAKGFLLGRRLLPSELGASIGRELVI